MRSEVNTECHSLGAIRLGLFEMVSLTGLELTKYSRLASQKAPEMSPLANTGIIVWAITPGFS